MLSCSAVIHSIVSFCNLLFQFPGPRESRKWREMVWRSPLTFPPTRQPSKTLHTLADISNSLMTTCTTVCIDTMSHNSSTSRHLKHKENQANPTGKGLKKLQVSEKKNFFYKCCVPSNVLYYPELILLRAQRSNLCRINLIVTINSSIKMPFSSWNLFYNSSKATESLKTPINKRNRLCSAEKKGHSILPQKQ